MISRIKSIGGAFILTIISSLIWEKFLSPNYSFFLEKMYDLISKVNSGFVDSSYRMAANLNLGYHSFSPITFLSLFFFMVMFISCLLKESSFRFSSFLEFLYSHNISRYYFLFISFTMIVMLFYSIVITEIADDIRRQIIREIESVSPYASDVEYREMRSMFYLMQGEDDFKKIQNKIQKIRGRS